MSVSTRGMMRGLLLLVACAQLGCGSRPGRLSPSDGVIDHASFDGPSDLLQHDQSLPIPPSRGIDLLLVAPADKTWNYSAAEGAFTARLVEQVLATTALAPKDIRLGMTFNQTETSPGYPPAKDPGGLVTSSLGTLFTGAQLEDWRKHAQTSLSEVAPDTYFEAAKLAIDGRNPGFPRPDALLVIVLFGTREDCTLAKPELLYDNSLWPKEYLHLYTRCYQPLPGMLRPPAEYVDVLLAGHPQRIFVVAVASREKALFDLDSGGYYWMKPRVHCQMGYLHAGRVAAFADAIDSRQHPRIGAGLLEYSEDSALCYHERAPELAAKIKAFAGLE